MMKASILTAIATTLATFVLSGCATYSVPANQAIDATTAPNTTPALSMFDHQKLVMRKDVSVVLAMSGGGTRAAALSYGVLKALRDIPIEVNGIKRPLLKEVDLITAVSGGSITAAYYGLRGERIFNEFEDRFLRRDIGREIGSAVLNPLHWFSRSGRTDIAADVLTQRLFGKATFADLARSGGPMVVINATDLARGVRFGFVNEYFNLICSDLASYPVANAVTASMAVPVVFNPVVLRNHGGCGRARRVAEYFESLPTNISADAKATTQSLASYANADKRPYVHLVDGGISDNLGLRAMLDIINIPQNRGVSPQGRSPSAVASLPVLSGQDIAARAAQSPIQRLIVIVIDASTEPESTIDQSNKVPSIPATLNAVTDTQLHRYSQLTLDEAKRTFEYFAGLSSTPEKPVSAYFIHLSINNVTLPETRHHLNQIPTALGLPAEDVRLLIDTGEQLLRQHPALGAAVAPIKTINSAASR